MPEQLPDITKEASMQDEAVRYAYYQLHLYQSSNKTLPKPLQDSFIETIRSAYMQGVVSGFQIGYILGQKKVEKELVPIINYYKKVNYPE